MITSRTNGPTRIGLVSSEPIRRLGLASAFEQHASIVVVGGDLDTILSSEEVGYIILDVSQDVGWIESLLRVRRARQDLRVIVVGPADNAELMLRSLASGARGYLDPNSSPHAIRRSVETVIEGYIWAPRRVLSVLIDRLLGQSTVTPARAVVTAFSPRERQVLDMITSGHSNREIALELRIEERTVKSYVASLFRKVGVENRVSLSVQTIRQSDREKRVRMAR